MVRPLLLLLVTLLARTAAAEEEFPALARRVPHFAKRLASPRWQVRYSLLRDLDGRDAETKRALERLARDPDGRVANQALVRLVRGFVHVDRALFRPAVCFPGRLRAEDWPEGRALVDYCLGRRELATGRDPHRAIAPLDPLQKDSPTMADALTVVGFLGEPADAVHLLPFLDSPNYYVALTAAKAVVRLGDRARGTTALVKLAGREPREHLVYVTEALYALRELEHPEFEALVRKVLAAVAEDDEIQPNWLDGFLHLAAEVTDEAWSGGEGSKGSGG